MKTINLNFQPLNRHGQPHVIDTTCAVFLADILDRRINKERPALEANVATQLLDTGSFELPTDTEDIVYIYGIVQQLEIDNLLKGQILHRFQ